MFPSRYFTDNYFPARFFPVAGETLVLLEEQAEATTLRLGLTGFSIRESTVINASLGVLLTGIDIGRPRCFAGIKFFSDSAGLVPVTPTAGTITIEISTFNTHPELEEFSENIIDAPNPITVSWAANTRSVKAVPTGLVGANFYRLVVTCNEN